MVIPSLREAAGTLKRLFKSVLLLTVTSRETVILMIQTNLKLPDVTVEISVVRQWHAMGN
jgi:hypothetical protein